MIKRAFLLIDIKGMVQKVSLDFAPGPLLSVPSVEMVVGPYESEKVFKGLFCQKL